MNGNTTRILQGKSGRLAFLGALVAGLLIPSIARAATISVVDDAGNPVAGYRWLVEEDTTA